MQVLDPVEQRLNIVKGVHLVARIVLRDLWELVEDSLSFRENVETKLQSLIFTREFEVECFVLLSMVNEEPI